VRAFKRDRGIQRKRERGGCRMEAEEKAEKKGFQKWYVFERCLFLERQEHAKSSFEFEPWIGTLLYLYTYCFHFYFPFSAFIYLLCFQPFQLD